MPSKRSTIGCIDEPYCADNVHTTFLKIPVLVQPCPEASTSKPSKWFSEAKPKKPIGCDHGTSTRVVTMSLISPSTHLERVIADLLYEPDCSSIVMIFSEQECQQARQEEHGHKVHCCRRRTLGRLIYLRYDSFRRSRVGSTGHYASVWLRTVTN